MKRQIFITVLFAIFSHAILAQEGNTESNEETFTVTIDGKKYDAIIENGDTLIFANLKEMSITSPPTLENADQKRRWILYKRYAGIVYPYAVKAVRIFRETEYVTQNMNKRRRKKHIKDLQKRLEEEFEDPLKKMTKIQGMMLTKMIEKELEESTFDLIVGLKGRMTATYYSTMGLMYNYNLKRGYIEGDDPLLDIILKDFPIDYNLREEIEENKSDDFFEPVIPVEGQ